MFQASRFMTISSCLDARWSSRYWKLSWVRPGCCSGSGLFCTPRRWMPALSTAPPRAPRRRPPWRGKAASTWPGHVAEHRAFNSSLRLLALAAQPERCGAASAFKLLAVPLPAPRRPERLFLAPGRRRPLSATCCLAPRVSEATPPAPGREKAASLAGSTWRLGVRLGVHIRVSSGGTHVQVASKQAMGGVGCGVWGVGCVCVCVCQQGSSTAAASPGPGPRPTAAAPGETSSSMACQAPGLGGHY
jgi:hypothetical protein